MIDAQTCEVGDPVVPVRPGSIPLRILLRTSLLGEHLVGFSNVGLSYVRFGLHSATPPPPPTCLMGQHLVGLRNVRLG
jgi:hypothetical protein